jgi:predicted PurR-regulated permease PerM
MISLQAAATVSELKSVISTNDATITGILIAVVLAFAFTIVYLFKNVQTLNKDYIQNIQDLNEKYINELRASNEMLLKVNNSYNEFANNMLKVMNLK